MARLQILRVNLVQALVHGRMWMILALAPYERCRWVVSNRARDQLKRL